MWTWIGYLCAWGLDPQFCHAGTDVPGAVRGIFVAVSVLGALTPTLMKPLLRLIGEERAVEALCVPPEREGIAGIAIGILAVGSLMWALTPLLSIPESFWELIWLVTLVAATLYFSALTAGAAILICLGVRKADNLLGRGLTSVASVALFVSVIVAAGHDPYQVWLAIWFPFALALGQLTRHIKGVAWKATGLVGALWSVVIVTRAIHTVAARWL